MDAVRFGKALGMGARSAAKALAVAADAAVSPNPAAARPKPANAAPQPAAARPTVRAEEPAPAGPIATAARATARATIQARETTRGVAQGSKRFGEAVWGPLVKISGVLWLEITGAFFGLFALFAGQAVWAHRADLRAATADHDAHVRAFVFLGMAALFGYFCVSSFVRAKRKERSQ